VLLSNVGLLVARVALKRWAPCGLLSNVGLLVCCSQTLASLRVALKRWPVVLCVAVARWVAAVCRDSLACLTGLFG
jgi:hypothetical protein